MDHDKSAAFRPAQGCRVPCLLVGRDGNGFFFEKYFLAETIYYGNINKGGRCLLSQMCESERHSRARLL